MQTFSFSEAWKLTFRNKANIGRWFLCGLLMLVPILNIFMVAGLGAQQSCKVAWGDKRGALFETQNITRSAGYAFVVSLVFGIVSSIVSFIFYAIDFIPFMSLIGSILTVIIGAIGSLAIARSEIYKGNFGAAFDYKFYLDMINRDRSLFFRYILLILLVDIILIALTVILTIGIAGTLVFKLIGTAALAGEEDVLYALSGISLGGLVIKGFILVYVIALVGFAASMLNSTIAGLYMNQFNPSKWGNYKDGLPRDISYNNYSEMCAAVSEEHAPNEAVSQEAAEVHESCACEENCACTTAAPASEQESPKVEEEKTSENHETDDAAKPTPTA